MKELKRFLKNMGVLIVMIIIAQITSGVLTGLGLDTSFEYAFSLLIVMYLLDRDFK